jgi:hypothetical protein
MRAVAVALASLALACDSHGAPPASLASDSAPDAGPTPSATVSPAPPPSYDLAADFDARCADARSRFGEGAALEVEAAVFLFIGARRDRVYDAGLKLARDALFAYFNDRFVERPDRAVSVYVFPSGATYDAFCKERLGTRCASPLGVYRHATRDIFVNAGPGITTLTHELVHPIIESDFLGAPVWLGEGLGSLFEMPVLPRAGEIHGAKNWRLPRLIAALRSKTERPTTTLDALFAMTDDDFHAGDEKLHYAMARYACQWLDERGKLWAFYRAWRSGAVRDPTGERAFAQVMGETPAQANEEWVVWSRRLGGEPQ